MNGNGYSKIKIESGIPLPRITTGRPPGEDPNSRCGVLRKMKKGQSAYFPKKMLATPKSEPQRIIAATARVVAARMKDGRKYTTRKVEGGVRIWRVA